MKNLTTLFLALFFFIFIPAKGQDIPLTKKDTTRSSYWGISLNFGNYFRTIEFYNNYFKQADTLEVKRFGLNGGLIFRRDINKKFQFETGLFLNNKGYKTKEYIITEYYSSPHSSPYINYYKVQDIFDFIYLDIPFKFHYRLNMSKLFLSASAGIILNISTSSYNNGTIIQLTYNGPSHLYDSSDDPIHTQSGWSGSGQLSLNYSLERSIFSISTYYERSLQPLRSNNVWFFSYGIGINYLHKF